MEVAGMMSRFPEGLRVRVVAGRKIAQSRTQHRSTPHAASDEVACQKCTPSAWRAATKGHHQAHTRRTGGSRGSCTPSRRGPELPRLARRDERTGLEMRLRARTSGVDSDAMETSHRGASSGARPRAASRGRLKIAMALGDGRAKRWNVGLVG
jgi:hypothetical protein